MMYVLGGIDVYKRQATYTQDNSGNYNTVQQNLTVKVTPVSYKLTLKAKNDFNKFNDNESDLEGNFKAWVYDVIC